MSRIWWERISRIRVFNRSIYSKNGNISLQYGRSSKLDWWRQVGIWQKATSGSMYVEDIGNDRILVNWYGIAEKSTMIGGSGIRVGHMGRVNGSPESDMCGIRISKVNLELWSITSADIGGSTTSLFLYLSDYL